MQTLVRVAGNSDRPLFATADVARALGYRDATRAIVDHYKKQHSHWVLVEQGWLIFV